MTGNSTLYKVGVISYCLKPGLLKLCLTAKEPMAALKIRQELILQDIAMKESVLLFVGTHPGSRSIDRSSTIKHLRKKEAIGISADLCNGFKTPSPPGIMRLQQGFSSF